MTVFNVVIVMTIQCRKPLWNTSDYREQYNDYID